MKQEIGKVSINHEYITSLRNKYIYEQHFYKEIHYKNGKIATILYNIKTYYNID